MLCHDGEIRPVLKVSADDGGEIDIAYRVAVGEDDHVCSASRYEIRGRDERSEPGKGCGILAARVVGGDVRRKDLDARRAPGKVPVLAVPDVIEKRAVVVAGHQSDSGYARIDHVRERKVYETVSRAERNARHRSHAGELGNAVVVHVGENKTCGCHGSFSFSRCK